MVLGTNVTYNQAQDPDDEDPDDESRLVCLGCCAFDGIVIGQGLTVDINSMSLVGFAELNFSTAEELAKMTDEELCAFAKEHPLTTKSE